MSILIPIWLLWILAGIIVIIILGFAVVGFSVLYAISKDFKL